MSIKYHQLEAFYQVMLTGSISKAAKNLNRTQPAVSMTIYNLEDQLGTMLFDRHAGRITPRVEAQILFEQTSAVMQQMNDIRQRFGGLNKIAAPRISIISSNIAGTHLIPAAVANIVAEGQELRLMHARSATIISEIENQRYDIGVMDEGTTEVPLKSPLFEVERFSIQVCAVFSPGLISAPPGPISTKDIADYQLCTLYEENRAAHGLKFARHPPRVKFSSFFPMACFALMNGSVAIVDYVTCKALDALTSGTLRSEWRVIGDLPPTTYYLLRPRYRPRSGSADSCYEAIRRSLSEIQAP